ncbi:MAG: GNAT family N-acetyltransferase [Beijerinckiaceae bacterium]
MSAVTIRDATEADLPAILALHNHHIAHTLAIWRYELADLDERRAWFRDRIGAGYPVLVADDPDGGDAPVGYASYGPFRTGTGYGATVEDSIYVRDDRQRRGIAQALMAALIARAQEQQRHVMMAGIGLPNDASVALHARFGFTACGRLREIGRKNGQWLDLLLMQKIL